MKKMNKGFTLIEILVCVAILVIILVMGGCVIGGCTLIFKGGKSVSENGLKGSIDRVWNGPSNGSQYVDSPVTNN